MSDLRSQVVDEARRSTASPDLSAADVVRAYYRIASPDSRSVGTLKPLRTMIRERFDNVPFLIFATFLMCASVVGSILVIALARDPFAVGLAYVFGSFALLGGVAYVALLIIRLREESRLRTLRAWDEGADDNGPNDFESIRAAFPGYTQHGNPVGEVNDISRTIFLNRWIEIENKIERLYSEVLANNIREIRRPFGGKVNELRSIGALSPALNDRLVDLLRIRNNVMHSRDVPSNIGPILADIDLVNRELSALIEKGKSA